MIHDFYRNATMPEPPLTPPDPYEHVDGCEEDCGDECQRWAREDAQELRRDMNLGR